ncbi:MAG: hypothetical protein Q4C98_10105, partial [Capnocytophaga sp.]|nr:hypothetical protein [Capnocytophaga sp.]
MDIDVQNIFRSQFTDIQIDIIGEIIKKAEIIKVKKNETLVNYQAEDLKLYFIAQGSFIHNLITSRGEERTIMFHTESFNSFFKSYDTVFQHKKTDYTIKANENSVIIAFPFYQIKDIIFGNLPLLNFYIQKTEDLLITIQQFHNFRMAFTAEEYLQWLYESYPFVFQRFSAQNIANFMGITP